MGNPISRIQDEAIYANNEDKLLKEERLKLMEKMVSTHLQLKKLNILSMKERRNLKLHSHTAHDCQCQVNVLLANKPSQNLETAINNFFSGHMVMELGILIQNSGVKAVLGNCSMGEYETSEMFLICRDKRLLLCDAYCYRWNFATKGVVPDIEGVVGILVLQRDIDLSVTNPHILFWAISHQKSILGKKHEAKQIFDIAAEVLDEIVTHQVATAKKWAEVPINSCQECVVLLHKNEGVECAPEKAPEEKSNICHEEGAREMGGESAIECLERSFVYNSRKHKLQASNLVLFQKWVGGGNLLDGCTEKYCCRDGVTGALYHK